MLTISNIHTLKTFIENDGYVIRDIIECNSYNALYFSLVGLYQSYSCFSEDSDVIDYIFYIH